MILTCKGNNLLYAYSCQGMSEGWDTMSGGKKLFAEVTGLTGLPEDLISEELKVLLERKGVAPEQMTMESLREALSDYLTEVIFQMESEDDSSILASSDIAAAPPMKAPSQ